MKKRIILIGGGGHAKVVIDAIKSSGEFSIYGIVDSKLSAGTKVLGVKVLGDDRVLSLIHKKGVKNAFIVIGSIGNCSVRKRIYENLKKIGFSLPVIRHPKSIIAEDVELEDGAFIAAGVIVNPGTKIGKNAIINTSSSIDHDCIIGDFVHIAPGATLSGGVKVGDETHIGTGANVIQNIIIRKNYIVAAGSTIRRNII